MAKALAGRAWEHGQGGARVIVYCNSRKTAQEVHEDLRSLLRKDYRDAFKAGAKLDDAIELIVGARRVFERGRLAGSAIFQRFLSAFQAAETTSPALPAFIVATSAGEVGIDINADHMVCDLVAWERMVQRLGRVNRIGRFKPTSLVDVFPATSDKDREAEDPIGGEHLRQWSAPFASALWQPENDGRRDASPGALIRLRGEPAFTSLTRDATTPPPLRPALTRALADAWSMTSLEEHTGRPEVQPWLRGWVEEERPQTVVVWRAHLPARRGEQAEMPPAEVNAFFDAAPPHLSEELETDTDNIVDWLLARASALSKRSRPRDEDAEDSEDDGDTEVEASGSDDPPREPLAADDVIAFVLTPADELKIEAGSNRPLRYRLSDLAGRSADKKLKGRLERELGGATLVVDARLAGLTNGLLDAKESAAPRTADDGEEWLSVADGRPAVLFRVDRRTGPQARYVKSPRTEFFTLRRDKEGNDIEVLAVESWTTEESRSATSEQALDAHQALAAEKAHAIAEALNLPADYKRAFILAARLHDEGKRAEIWQRAFNAPRQADGKGKIVYAKTKGPINQSVLAGYRHEFGSLPAIASDPAFKALPPKLQDLVLHLVAAHHGNARPLIGTSGCEDGPPSALEERARDVALRFARLQKRWGPWGLAWWEALLRAADQQASRDDDAADDAAKAPNGKPTAEAA